MKKMVRKDGKNMKDAKGRTIRKTLKESGRGKKLLDMEEVYRLLDEGRTVKEVAQKLCVSVNTVYKRHQEYQEQIKEEQEQMEAWDDLPPLPEDL